MELFGRVQVGFQVNDREKPVMNGCIQADADL
jgi:hypothetical protein